ncbi:MAG: undecaprenyl-diphosphate phosphatase [Chloroflexi bacterium]|nr:undecaprenyl-diphosphate phosphatase [Chloroflexota bacterium]
MVEVSELIKAVILGIVEGITEFLPISSTGHLIVASALLDFQIGLEGTFEIFIQLGAVVAVVAFYRRDLFRQLRTVRADRGVQRLWLAIAVAFLPAAVIGLLLRDWIKAVLFSPVVVAITLIVGGVLLIVVERRPGMQSGRLVTTEALDQIGWRQAVVIGFAQTLALVPGVSRSAASIIGGMFSGLSRQTATQFSFYLAIPTLGGATVVDLLLSLDEIGSDELVYLAVGTVVSAVVAWFAIGWLLRYVSNNNFIPFGYYRIAAGLIFLLLAAAAVI